MENTNTNTNAVEQRVIGVAQVLEQLAEGMTRDEIGTYYGLTKADVNQMFKHPDLKGKKTARKPGFVLVADANVVGEVAQMDVVNHELIQDTPPADADFAGDTNDTTEQAVAFEKVADVPAPEVEAAKSTWAD